jgi:hypothetical protein
VTATAPAAISVDQRVTIAIEVTASVGTPTGIVEVVGADGDVLATATLIAGTVSTEVVLAVRGQYRLTVRYPAQAEIRPWRTAPWCARDRRGASLRRTRSARAWPDEIGAGLAVSASATALATSRIEVDPCDGAARCSMVSVSSSSERRR